LWCALAASLAAQQKPLSLDVIYDPETRINFSGHQQPEIAWIDGSHYGLGQTRGREGVEWNKVDAATGQQSPLFDSARMEMALAAVAGISDDEAQKLAHARTLTFNSAHTAALLSIHDDLYVYSFDKGVLVRLTNAPGSEDQASFSPDGTWVAFVRGNNLYV